MAGTAPRPCRDARPWPMRGCLNEGEAYVQDRRSQTCSLTVTESQMWHPSPVAIPLSVDQCQNLVCVGEIKFSPVLLAVLVVAAGSLMLFALRTSGG